jgi:hypothetical protein
MLALSRTDQAGGLKSIPNALATTKLRKTPWVTTATRFAG